MQFIPVMSFFSFVFVLCILYYFLYCYCSLPYVLNAYIQLIAYLKMLAETNKSNIWNEWCLGSPLVFFVRFAMSFFFMQSSSLNLIQQTKMLPTATTKTSNKHFFPLYDIWIVYNRKQVVKTRTTDWKRNSAINRHFLVDMSNIISFYIIFFRLYHRRMVSWKPIKNALFCEWITMLYCLVDKKREFYSKKDMPLNPLKLKHFSCLFYLGRFPEKN